MSENQSLERYYKTINKNIKTIDRQIIILLDDLDRLETEEILNSLKLIRTISDFNNVIFIAGYDRRYIEDSLGKNKHNYLDKIFNVELNLLPFNEKRVADELISLSHDIYPMKNRDTDNLSFTSAFQQLFRKDSNPPLLGEINLDAFLSSGDFRCSDLSLGYRHFLLTYRDVKRFLNEFKFSVSFLGKENDVVPQEYILLRLLTYKYRELQNLIFNHLDELLVKGVIDIENGKFVEQNGYSEIYVYNQKSKLTLKELLSSYSKHDFEIINAVLCQLFGEKNPDYYRTNQNCISKIYHTNIYVRNNLVGGNITHSELQEAYESASIFELAQDVVKISQQSSGQLKSEIRTFILQNPPKDKRQFTDFLKTINAIMNLNIHQDDEKALKIMSSSMNFYSNKKEFLIALSEIIKILPSEYLINLFSDININIKRRKREEIYTSGVLIYKENFLEEEDIENLLIEKLRDYVNSGGNKNDIIHLYNQMVKRIVADKKILKPQTANELLKKDIIKRFNEYYTSPIFNTIGGHADRKDLDFNGIVPYAFFPQIFSNPKTHQKLLKGSVSEERFQEYLKEGWQNFYSFLEGMLKSNDSEKEYDKNLERTLKTVFTFIQNDYKGLNEQQYKSIWGETSNKGFTPLF